MSTPAPVVIGLVANPAPTDEEAAAIVAAVELAWPRTVVVVNTGSVPAESGAWRWSGRWWVNSPRSAGARRRP
jgi:hypothetical protein